MELLLLLALQFASVFIVMKKFTTASEEFNQTNGTHNDNTITSVFNKAFPQDYDAQDAPTDVVIHVGVAYISIPSVKFARMEIETEFYFGARWKDDRLIFDETTEKLGKKHEMFTVPGDIKNRLWIPDIMFSECKSCDSGMATRVGHGVLMFFPETKMFMIGYRDSMLFGCFYDLTYYPFDVHECQITLELADMTFTNGSKTLVNSYDMLFKHPMEEAPDPGLPSEFYFDNLFVQHACSRRLIGPPRDPDRCLQYGIRFHRIAAYYLMIVYTPSCTIVLVSWISFWLAVDTPAPRVTLGLTSLLTLTTQFSNAQKDLPPVAYIKALDIWMLMCVIMVFGSLLEFTLAHTKLFMPKSDKRVFKSFVKNESKDSKTTFVVKKRIYPMDAKGPKPVNWLDAKARIIFPIVFVLFNVAYWPYCSRDG